MQRVELVVMLVGQESFRAVFIGQPIAEGFCISRWNNHDVNDLLLPLALIRDHTALKRTSGGLDEAVEITDLHRTERGMP